MTNASDEIKVGSELPSVHPKSTLKVVVLWVLILVVAVGLYDLVLNLAGKVN